MPSYPASTNSANNLLKSESAATFSVRSPPKIDRALLPRIEALTKESIAMAVGDSLTSYEADAVLKRRDLIVAHFRKLIAEQGEDRVLY